MFRMVQVLRYVLAGLTLSGAGYAQTLQIAGSGLTLASVTYTRGPAGYDAGELMMRFDADDMRGYGVESAFPGVQVVRGVALVVRDFGSSTPNNLYDVTIYTESATQPGYPDLAAPLGGSTGLIAGGGFGYVPIVFATPALAPIGRDLFVGVRVPGTTSQVGGIRLAVFTSNPASSTYDLAGPALPTSPPEENSFRLYRDLTTNAVTYGTRGQYLLDLLTTSPSGSPTTISFQAGYPTSNGAPGASTMISGFHPDAASPPLNAGRADDVAFLYRDLVLALGSPVMFLGAFADFGPLVPLDTYLPGSIGGICLDQGQIMVLGFGTLGFGSQCYLVSPIPAGARPWIRGISWTQQAIGFDTVNGTLHGTQCGKQQF